MENSDEKTQFPLGLETSEKVRGRGRQGGRGRHWSEKELDLLYEIRRDGSPVVAAF